MGRTFREWNPDQSWLSPPAPQDWLQDGQLVHFLSTRAPLIQPQLKRSKACGPDLSANESYPILSPQDMRAPCVQVELKDFRTPTST